MNNTDTKGCNQDVGMKFRNAPENYRRRHIRTYELIIYEK